MNTRLSVRRRESGGRAKANRANPLLTLISTPRLSEAPDIRFNLRKGTQMMTLTTTLEAAPVMAPSKACLCGCKRLIGARSGRGRPTLYATPECKAKADNQRDRDRRAAERASLDGFLSRAIPHGWLEPKQIPATALPDGYWTNLALAVQVEVFHGPAADSPDDTRPAEFTRGVCSIIRDGTAPEGVVLLELDDAKRTTVHAVDDSAQDRLGRLWELRDPLRSSPSWMASAAWDDHGTAVPAVDLYGNPVAIYAPLGPRPTDGASRDYRSCAVPKEDTYETCQEYYDRDPRRPWRAPYFGIAWNHGPEAIADHIRAALAAYAEDAT